MSSRVTDKSIYLTSILVITVWVTASILLAVLSAGLVVRILIGLVPVGFLTLQIWQAYRYTRSQDEVQKTIILEGLSLGFSIALPLIFLVGFLIKAGVRLPLGFIDAGYFMEVALLIGYGVAYRRYR